MKGLIGILTLVLALAVPVSLAAHPGHAHKVMGTVSVIHENHLEVKHAKGNVSALVLTEKTKIMRGKTVMRATDIKVGDRVVVTANETKGKDGKTVLTVASVQLAAAPASAPTKR